MFEKIHYILTCQNIYLTLVFVTASISFLKDMNLTGKFWLISERFVTLKLNLQAKPFLQHLFYNKHDQSSYRVLST